MRRILLSGLVAAFAIAALLVIGPTHSAEASHDSAAINLVAGANLTVYDGPTLPLPRALNNVDEITIAVWRFDAATQSWQVWTAALPQALRGFSELEHGRAYFLIVAEPAIWQIPAAQELPAQPPALRLIVRDQSHEATLGSYCWPVEPGVGICVDSVFPVFDTFIAVSDGQIVLEIDAPLPDTITLSLRPAADALAPLDSGTTRIDAPGRRVTWTPGIDLAPGNYILSAFATWQALGGQGGDATYILPVALERLPAPFPTQLERAPIESAEFSIAESFPPQYFVAIVSGLPNGCAQFERIDLQRDGTTIRIDVWNRVPTPTAEIACIQIYGIVDHNVALGSDFEPGVEYTVQINDLTRIFVAQ